MNVSDAAFDAYACTPVAVAGLLLDGLSDALGADRVEHDAPKNGYTRAQSVFLGDEKLLTVMHGGYNPLPFVSAQGQTTPAVVSAVRRLFPEHSVSRVDAKVDVDAGPGTWDLILPQVHDLAIEKGLKWKHIVSSGTDDQGFNPATHYIGSEKSRMMNRTYCKGAQLIREGVDLTGTGYTPYTVRCENQGRPASSQKARFATATPEEVLGATPWTRTLYKRILGLSTGKLSLGHVRHLTDDQRTTAHMLRMFDRHIQRTIDIEGYDVAVLMFLGARR